MSRASLLASSALGFAGIALAMAGCLTSSNTTGSGYATTLVTVSPASFRGSIACGDLPGAMQSYVATLTDVSVSPPFELASSGPVPCAQPVSFAFVVPGHGYVASIQAFDRAPSTLAPLGGQGSGSPKMVDATTGARVAPRWTTRCGSAPDGGAPYDGGDDAGDAGGGLYDVPGGPTYAWWYEEIPVQSCLPLGGGPTGPTGLVVDLDDARVAFACGEGAGEVDHFTVTPSDPSLAPATAACADSVEYTVAPGATYAFDVAAFAKGSPDPTWGTRCVGNARDGLVLRAACDPLASSGSLRIPIAAVLAAAGRTCGGDVLTYHAKVDGQALVVPTTACHEDTILGPLPASSTVDGGGAGYTVELTLDPGGTTLSCPGLVLPPGKTLDVTGCQ